MRKPKGLLQITKVAALAIIEQADYYSAKQDGLLAHRWEWGSGRCNSPLFPQHLVFYEYLREQRLVCIVYVIHGARDVEGLLAGF